MKKLSGKMKKEAAADLEMYFGKPPYNSEYVRHHVTSGLFEEQALMKYGLTPIEPMKELEIIRLSRKMKKEALKDLKMYFGEPPVPRNHIKNRMTSALLEMQILAKYLMTVDELMKEVGFEISDLLLNTTGSLVRSGYCSPLSRG
ncbi:MAG: hypothetical protein ABSB79_16075 [Syntrophales bacterium]|jgi:hypothetical protein